MDRQRRQRRQQLLRRFGLRGDRRQVLACALMLCLVGLGACLHFCVPQGMTILRSERSEGSSTREETPRTGSAAAPEPQEVPCAIVDVDGAVVHPGVYELRSESCRVRDAVTAAGGLAADADTTRVNLAAPIADGEKVYVPHEGDETVPTAVSPRSSAASTGDAHDAQGAASSTRVDINRASIEELQELPGIGEVTAAAIIEERETHGPFSPPEDVMRVSGIGEKKYAKLKDRICV